MKENLTQGKEKIRNYFENRLELDVFQEKIKGLRKTYGVPENGYPLTSARFFNDKIAPPDVWENSHRWSELHADLEKLIVDFDLIDSFHYYLLFEYFFFNYLKESFLNEWTPDLCNLEDRTEILKSIETVKEAAGETLQRSKIEADTEEYPITINISAYASRNDIVNFIDKNLKRIKSLQDKYADPNSKIGKIRTRPSKKREKAILEKEHLPRKEIVEKLSNKYPSLDSISVRNTISRGKKRRKEV